MRVDEILPSNHQKWLGRGFCLRRNLNVAYFVAYDEVERQHLLSIVGTNELKILLPDEFGEATCHEG